MHPLKKLAQKFDKFHSKNKVKVYSIFSVIVFFVILVFFLFIPRCSQGIINELRTYRIALDPSSSSIELLGKEISFQAFIRNIVTLISKEAGIHTEVYLVPTNRLYSGLDEGQYDAIISFLSPDAITRIQYQFSEPFFLVGPVLVVRNESTVDSLDDLKGKVIGIVDTSAPVFRMIQSPNIIISPFDSEFTALENLEANKIDALLMNPVTAYVYTQGFFADKLKVTTSPLTDEGLRLVALNLPKYTPLIEAFNKGIQILKEKGTYEELLTKWGFINPKLDNANAK